ncbi:MAG: group II intron reverse transcriptase/maturase [Planctomycetota bacterium]|nr:MAG: group II intron reverse transcriptase/maturase [Planctomycetota bacterium]
MHPSLQGISKRAIREKSYQFDNLYSLLNVSNLEWCFHKLNKKAGVGVDGVSWQDYEKNLDSNLKDLVDRLKKKSYKARLVKRKYIPKLNGKMRPLGIPSIEDKIVQHCASQILESIYEQDFQDFSYGYRPNVGALDAVKDLFHELQQGDYHWIVEADIKGFFDNIDHDWLIKMLEERIRDKALLGLIRKWLKAGILDEDGELIHPKAGTPQGGIISPILANIYLHYSLDLWFQKKVKTHCKGKAFIVRYADDFVAGFQDGNDAEKYYSVLDKRLEKFNLNVEPSKTNKLQFTRNILDHGEHFEFLGFSFHWRSDRRGNPLVVKTTMKKKFTASVANFKGWIKKNRNCKITHIMRILKAKLQGYWNYYGLRGNFKMLKSYWEASLSLLFKWLNRRSQRSSYTMKGLVDMLNFFKIPRPRITETFKRKRVKPLWH